MPNIQLTRDNNGYLNCVFVDCEKLDEQEFIALLEDSIYLLKSSLLTAESQS
jgi:hypothetical protein